MHKLVQQMQQHDKLQVESKQQLADVKKKLLESQTEIVKLHCKLQEVCLPTCVLCTDVHNINNQKIQICLPGGHGLQNGSS